MGFLWFHGGVVNSCPDTFAPSFSVLASSEAGLVAAQAEEKKWSKYLHLASDHSFTPVAIETSGVITSIIVGVSS